MARNRSVDFLPEIFKTDPNKEFLSATLDQLTQEPKLKQIQGYIGNKFKAGATSEDTYLTEPTIERANYQLETGVVFKNENNDVEQAITYPEIIDALKTQGANVTRHDRLFSSEAYSWSPLIDLDKFVNHTQYYWLPTGPDSVDVQATDIFIDEYNIIENEKFYGFDEVSGENPTITLARGGNYVFNNLDTASGTFYIQTEIGTSGQKASTPNVSTREVFGVTNNGSNKITFNVPQATDQQFYHDLTAIDDIDLATFARFDSINGAVLSNLKTIDGIADLNGKTIVFLDKTAGDSADLGWQYLDLWEDNDRFEEDPYGNATYIDSQADRYSVYKIQYLTTGNSTVLKLNKIKAVNKHEKFNITYGKTYAGLTFYKNSVGYFDQVPVLTASQNKLYYQDGTDENRFGIINLVDNIEDTRLEVDNDIVGKPNYKSPNGVEFTNGLKVKFRGNIVPETYKENEYWVEGVGTGIILIPTTDLITPETFAESETQPYDSLLFDSGPFDEALSSPLGLDYFTINRASKDLNPWTRGNRWVHRNVIEKTAEYNNTTPVFDNNNRAVRPIIEFKPNLKLFNYGTESLGPVNIIDLTETDALSNVNGAASHEYDSYGLVDDSKVIFANDTDPNVRNKIYTVKLVDVQDDDVKEIRLIEDATSILTDHLVVVTNGATQQGKVYHYNGTSWVESQQKTKLNQEPLYDVYDTNGNSFGNTTTYKRTTFAGTKVFAYGRGVGLDDATLGFPLKYLSIDNIGDIVFENHLYTDTFTYDITDITKNVSDGFVRKYSDRTTYTDEIGWTAHIDEFVDDQVFNFEYDGTSLVLDVLLKSNLNTPNIKVYIDGKYCPSSDYTVTQSLADNTTTVTFDIEVTTGADIYVTAISDQASQVAYYSIPFNLENNPFNENSTEFTLGTVRNHYIEMGQNLKALTGDISGSNNSRDLPNIEKYSRNIIQNSSPVIPLAKFLHSDKFDYFASLEFASNAYEKFKLKVIDYVNKNDTYDMTASDVLDAALKEINIGKNSLNAYYKSDMLPGATTPTTTKYTVTAITTTTFNTKEIYDFTQANSKAILVYINGVILTKDEDYTVGTDSANITITKTLSIGDVITINEYDTTVGSYVPNTPSKMGLHPVYVPKKYTDNSYLTATEVIQGHDGSITVAYGDSRDDVLLEFENRIYNNIKVTSDNLIPIIESDVIPGKFRTTDYTDEEVTSILSISFLTWLASNRLEYKTQDYSATNEFTWNYTTAGSILDGKPLKGHWRGVYRNYYDTDTPHTTPWEMLGLSKKPTWWEDEYGPAPYTRGNLVLWEDLEAGTIRDPNNTRTDTRYARPGLTDVIPVDTAGRLISPFEAMVNNYNSVDFKKSWVFGDQGPTETAWRRSSSYRFALQRLYALTKPAKYFALNIDRDLYKYNDTIEQYLWNGRYRLNATEVVTQTVTQPKHSYINWIADYHNNNGCSCTEISQELARTDVRLCYRMASFTDKSYLKVFTDKSSPDSSNTGLQIPDQNYKLLLHKNMPVSELQFSGVIVQRTDDGYSIYGHSKTQPYFEIYRSITSGNSYAIGDYLVPTEFKNTVTTVPYGYVFTSKGAVVDFLASYGAFLEDKGMVFDDTENTTSLNWGQMAEEFLAWSGQDWGTGAIINLNPGAISLQFNKALLIVDDITKNNIDALDQNGLPLQNEDYAVTRLDNSFRIQTVNNKSINLLKIKSISYEHLMVLDNTSIFNDLIYQPVTGIRQQRLRVVGFNTFEWNGQLDAQGFILNQDNVEEWKQDTYYTMGSIVKYKNSYWSSVKKLEPKETFEFGDWRKISYENIKKGLLPNIASKAGQIREYYNKKTTNLESDVDLLAMGLLGYRPRDYLSTLDDVSRVNFYTRFIAEKGTTLSANVFKNVELDKQVTDYDIFENWAIKEATFGNSDNRVYVELELEKSKLESNPTLVEVVEDQSSITVIEGITADADYTADTTEITADPDRVVEIVRTPSTKKHQVIDVSDIYAQSTTHTNSDIFPIRTTQLTDTNLPTAGFVNTNDVDIALFEERDLNGISGIVFLNQIEDGTTIWVAKDNIHDWNVYRASNIIYSLSADNSKMTADTTDITASQKVNIQSLIQNEEGYIDITFYSNHGLTAQDKIVIQNISNEVNGYHSVHKVLSPKVLQVKGSIENPYVRISSDSSVTADTDLYTADHVLGNIYKLESLRVNTPIDLYSKYFNNLPIGSFAWVDTNTNNKYATYKKETVEGIYSADNSKITADTTVITADGDGAWVQYREQQDIVDTTLISKALIYDKTTEITDVNLDFIDPLNGKLLGAAQENIDYITFEDPATYNYDTGLTGVVWAEQHVGEIWWDITNTRFLDYYASDEVYASKNWGTLFPGSTVDVRQWVKSSLPPSKYTGVGTVVDATKYTQVSKVNSSNTITQNYYFWVTDVDNILNDKTLSLNNIKTYIATPTASGVPYAAFVDRSTVALYNANKYILDGILHVSYDKTESKNSVFNEFKLVKKNNKNSFLSDNTYLKLQDSLIGGNKIGLAVPDKALTPVSRIGVGFRPRQSMFVDRFSALKSYLTYVNDVLKQYVISTNKDFTQLNKAETMPTESSGEWDKKVSDLDELGYQNLLTVAVGYKYLVEADSDNQGGWSIYEVVSGPALQLIKVQSYDTTRSWSYVDWYKDTDAENAIFEAIVDDTSKLTSITITADKYVKVNTNSEGKFEVYQYVDGNYERVGLEDGTIAFNSTLWSGQSTQDNITVDSSLFTVDNAYNTVDTGTGGNELRNIIKAINEDLFTGDLLIERNKALMIVFDYILSEQQNIDWLTKTSFIDVEQKVRDLLQYTTYKKDDQEFLLNYLNESKPYHTVIKEFLLKYDGTDQYNADTLDFDCPAYYDTTFGKYISPVLDYDGVVLKSDQSNFDDDGIGLKETDYNIWETDPWDNWYNNRLLDIKSFTLVDGGTGYTEVPKVVVTGGGATTQATATARISSSGNITEIVLVTNGEGYISTPTVTIQGNGTGAVVTPVMQNQLVRNVKTTLKYDRVSYDTIVHDWEASGSPLTTVDQTNITIDSTDYTADGTEPTYYVRYNNKLYEPNTQGDFDSTFVLEDFTEVDSSTLTASDRTMGYYTPTVNMSGLNLSMLIDGVGYPGVEVTDVDFTDTTTALDVELNSTFGNTYLGTGVEDILTDGGAFIDEYSSHSPEELIPGAMYDTVDIKVHTRPGFDYQDNGHGFSADYVRYTYTTAGSNTFTFNNVVEHPIKLIVINGTTGRRLHVTEDYTVDWVNKTITVIANAFDQDTIQISVYEIGGGNQLYRNTYVGSDFGTTLDIPVAAQEIYEIVVFVNGVLQTSGYSSTADGKLTVDNTLTTADNNTVTVDKVSTVENSITTMSFITNYNSTDFISITVFGFESTQHDWSSPINTHYDHITVDTTSVTADSGETTADGGGFDVGANVYLGGRNKMCAIVEKNGFRLRPPEGVRYTGDGTETDFRLPTAGGIDHTLVSNSEIVVFVDNEKQTLSTDYTVVSVVDGSDTYKEVSFTTAPTSDSIVDVYTTYSAEYTISDAGILSIDSSVGLLDTDHTEVTTFNDTDQQDILTNVFVGPTTVTSEIVDLFDSVAFDTVDFDFLGSLSETTNLFNVGRDIANDNRLWVTLNGRFLLAEVDYSVAGSYILLAGDLIGATDVVAVTSFTSNLVPDAISFRWFKDMNGNVAMYKMDTYHVEKLKYDVTADADIMYLEDTANMPVPNLAIGNYGIVTIDAERITYRELDTVNHTISGLRRGTAGTAAAPHTKDTAVEDFSRRHLIENTEKESTTLDSITSTTSYDGDSIWYASGTTTASNGIALQNQTTAQAKFIKNVGI